MKKQIVKKYWPLFAIIVFLSVPFWNVPFAITFFTVVMHFSLLVLSFSFLLNVTGFNSLMQASLGGVAGYALAYLQVTAKYPFPFAEGIAIFLTLALSALVGIALVRTRRVYFLLLTMVLSLAIWALSLQWVSVTKGTTGLIGVRRPDFLSAPRNFYYFVLVLFVIFYLFFERISKSRFALLLKGIKQNEKRMKSFGYPISFLLWCAWFVSSVPVVFEGVLLVYQLGIMNPHNITLANNVYVLLAGLLAGSGSLYNTIFGALTIKGLEYIVSMWTERYNLISAVVMCIILFAREYKIMGKVYKRRREVL